MTKELTDEQFGAMFDDLVGKMPPPPHILTRWCHLGPDERQILRVIHNVAYNRGFDDGESDAKAAERAIAAQLREELAAAERGRPDDYLVSVYQALRGSRESSQELFDDDDEPHYERVLGSAKAVVAALTAERAETARLREELASVTRRLELRREERDKAQADLEAARAESAKLRKLLDMSDFLRTELAAHRDRLIERAEAQEIDIASTRVGTLQRVKGGLAAIAVEWEDNDEESALREAAETLWEFIRTHLTTPPTCPTCASRIEELHGRDATGETCTNDWHFRSDEEENGPAPVSPVCSHCDDSHEVDTERGRQMCTWCPVPCQLCRIGGNGAFCETTPCPCKCHRKPAPGDESEET